MSISPFSSPYDRPQQEAYCSQRFKSSCGETFQFFFKIQGKALQDASFSCSASQLVYRTLHTLVDYALHHTLRSTLALEENELVSLLDIPVQKQRLKDVVEVLTAFQGALREALEFHSIRV